MPDAYLRVMVKKISASCACGFRWQEVVPWEEELAGFDERNCYSCGVFYVVPLLSRSHDAQEGTPPAAAEYTCTTCGQPTHSAQPVLYRVRMCRVQNPDGINGCFANPVAWPIARSAEFTAFSYSTSD